MDDRAYELLADLNTNVATVQSDVSSMLAANTEAHTRFAETLKDHSEQLKTLDKSIRGNGKAGLSERMNRADKFMANFGKMGWAVIIATIFAVVGATVTVIVAFVTNMQTIQGATP